MCNQADGGTCSSKVKILGKQNDWYKVESDGKVGWLYRSAIGL